MLLWVASYLAATAALAAAHRPALDAAASIRDSGKCVPYIHHRPTSPQHAPGSSQIPLGFGENNFNIAVQSPPLEILPLVISGPSENRVDFVFFSDGYLQGEKSKFFDDAMYLAKDISGNQTFNTVQPLLNFWAAFTPSEESGVGVAGIPKKTPFGLYRPGTELRGLYYAYPKVADAACASMPLQCDYPILMGNDPLYGGLGGRFTTITPSLANGASILRHELGHSIIPVGEEYDGGFAYFGVNAYHDLSTPVPWAHWLPDPTATTEYASPRIERAVMPMQIYAWSMLNVSTAWSTTFDSPGTYSRYLVRFSLSGLPEKSDLKVELDGVNLEWSPRPGIGLDRTHYDRYIESPLSAGEHELKFTLLNHTLEGLAQMCSAEIIEFGNDEEFIRTPGNYGVYPTFSEANQTTYRPTNEDCLMRQVTTSNFCKVCLEGLWLSLLNRVNLIDSITERCDASSKTLDIAVVPLAQFRSVPIIPKETLSIVWSKDGHVLEAFTNRTQVSVEGGVAVGVYTVDVVYTTEEVKIDEYGLLTDRVEYKVVRPCGA